MRRLTTLPLLVALLAGCADDPFEPRSLLDAYRVLAIAADPPVVRPGGEVTLRVTDFAPGDLGPGEPPARDYVWSLCLYSLGALARFECLPGLSTFETTTEPTLAIDLGPGGTFARAPIPPELLAAGGPVPGDVRTFGDLVAALAAVPVPDDWEVPAERVGEGADPDALVFGDLAPDDSYGAILALVLTVAENTADLPTGAVDPDDVDVFVRLVASAAGSAQFEAAKRVRVRAEGPLNEPPRVLALLGLEEGARLPAGAAIDLRAEVEDPDIEEPTDLLLSWYVTGGDLDRDLASGELTDNTWELPDEAGPAQLFLVVRDRTGGVDVLSRRVEVVRAR